MFICKCIYSYYNDCSNFSGCIYSHVNDHSLGIHENTNMRNIFTSHVCRYNGKQNVGLSSVLITKK